MPTRSMFLSRASAALAIIGSATALGAQSPLVLVPVRVDQVMTRTEQAETGVASLTPEQRLKLSGWLTRYSAELRQGRLPVTPSRIAASRTVFAQPTSGDADRSPADTLAAEASAADQPSESDAPYEEQRAPSRRPRALAGPWTVPPGAPVVATPDDGAYVRLADGTLWEIYLPDRTYTEIWNRGDYVTVTRAPAAVGDYDHMLVNAPAHTRAYARLVGVARPRRR